MIIKYECEYCGELFNHEEDCIEHESSHLTGVEKIKYEVLNKVRWNWNEDICDYCDHSYYVYGCERDCEYKTCCNSNNYKNFIPTEPLHNKKSRGGV